ncbi:hypothetical protein JCM8097_006135 [Rhodosporidiobolus ruineniae]
MAPTRSYDFTPGPADGKTLKRSKTGCLACKQRKKKCTEQYVDGACTRCRDGGWKCHLPEHLVSSTSMFETATTTPRRPSPEPSSAQWTPTRDIEVTASSSASPYPPPVSASARQPFLPAFSPPANFAENLSNPSFCLSSNLGLSVGPPPATASGVDSLFSLETISTGDFDLDAFLAQLAEVEPNPAPLPPAPAVASQEQTHLSSLPVKDATDALLLQFYETNLSSAWTISYTPLARERQVAKCKDLITQFRTAKLGAKFAAAAYIKLFRLTSLGGVYSNFAGSSQPDLPPEYSHIDVDPLPLYEETLERIRHPDGSDSLEAKLYALVDLHIGITALDLPAQAYGIAFLADSLLAQAFAPGSTSMSWSAVHGISSWAVYNLAFINLMRSIRKRVPAFLRIDEEEAEKAHCAGHKNWFGLPPSLTALLFRVVNLCAAVHTSHRRTTSAFLAAFAAPLNSSYEHEALSVMQRLEDWRPTYSVYDQGRDRHSIAMAGEMTVQQETWRNLGLLLVHRLVFLCSPLHKTVADLLSKLLSNLKAISVLSRIRREAEPQLLDWWTSVYSTPAFLVGSIATGADRMFCKQFILSVGKEPQLQTMAEVLEATWAKTNATGIVADWWEVAEEQKLDWIFF